MAQLDPAHIVTKKNLYVVLSLLLFSAIVVVIHHTYKKHLAKVASSKIITLLVSKGMVDSIKNDPVAMLELHSRSEKAFYENYGLLRLYRMANMPDSEIAKIDLSQLDKV